MDSKELEGVLDMSLVDWSYMDVESNLMGQETLGKGNMMEEEDLVGQHLVNLGAQC